MQYKHFLEYFKSKNMKLLMVGLLIFISCNAAKKVIDMKNLAITLTKTECGSYEVKDNEALIGYVVKPFYVEVEKKENHIIQFEKVIKANYSDYYDRFYRTYWFSKNSVSDTLVLVTMLSAKQLSSIPNWQCEEQEADTYNQLYKNTNNNKHPRFFTFNYTKGRFKILGDPD
jgi:hypothetical protein